MTRVVKNILLAAVMSTVFATTAHAWNKAPADTPAGLKGKNVIEWRQGLFARAFGAGKPYFFVDKGISEKEARYTIDRCRAQEAAKDNREYNLYGTLAFSDSFEEYRNCLGRHGLHVLYRGPDNKLTGYRYRDLLQEY